MWIWLGGILVLLLIIIVLVVLYSKITLHLTVKKKNQDDTILLKVTLLFGMINFDYQIPVIMLKNLQEGIMIEQDFSDNLPKRQSKSSEQGIDKEKAKRWWQDFKELIKATKGLKKWVISTLRRVRVTRLEWSTNVALSDAAHTATLTGALWGVKSTLVGWLSYHILLMRRPKLFVVPVFGSPPFFSTDLLCIAEIRCGYAIYAGLVLIVRVLKVKGGVKKWLNILSKG